MSGKVYQCRVCGARVAVLCPGSGGLSCCRLPMEYRGGDGAGDCREGLDLTIEMTEIARNGKSCWQFLPAAAPA